MRILRTSLNNHSGSHPLGKGTRLNARKPLAIGRWRGCRSGLGGGESGGLKQRAAPNQIPDGRQNTGRPTETPVKPP